MFFIENCLVNIDGTIWNYKENSVKREKSAKVKAVFKQQNRIILVTEDSL